MICRAPSVAPYCPPYRPPVQCFPNSRPYCPPQPYCPPRHGYGGYSYGGGYVAASYPIYAPPVRRAFYQQPCYPQQDCYDGGVAGFFRNNNNTNLWGYLIQTIGTIANNKIPGEGPQQAINPWPGVPVYLGYPQQVATAPAPDAQGGPSAPGPDASQQPSGGKPEDTQKKAEDKQKDTSPAAPSGGGATPPAPSAENTKDLPPAPAEAKDKTSAAPAANAETKTTEKETKTTTTTEKKEGSGAPATQQTNTTSTTSTETKAPAPAPGTPAPKKADFGYSNSFFLNSPTGWGQDSSQPSTGSWTI